ncbi:MAG: MmgE/PrpD family protein [Oscillospiraceae bacterium]|nr:MmgE/PrpD family protein [Oscillospiraceae bacterium]
MNISQTLSAFISAIRAEELPESIRREVPLRIVDYAASAAAGFQVNASMNAIVMELLREQGGTPRCSLFFSREKLSAIQAAYYNAFVCNGADMDDGHMLANGHPGVCVIPPVLALAEERGLTYPDIAAAIVGGYELFIRLAGGMAPSHLQRGFNGTGTTGTIAAAAACARALRLDAEKTHVAIGLAATSASGLMELNESGQAMKPINPAKSAANGLLCALFAERGAVGPVAPLDGSKGYIRAFCDEADPAFILGGLGEQWLMDTAYIKLYPACRHMHAMADCAGMLHRRGIPTEQISGIRLYTYPASEKLTGLIRYPSGEDEAKFSLTYAAAVALRTGGFTLEDLRSASNLSPELRDLIGRMEIIVEPELEDRKNMLRGARMELIMAGGRTESASVRVPKGEKINPLQEGDLRAKLAACAGALLPPERQEALYMAGMQFGEVPDVTKFYALTAAEA